MPMFRPEDLAGWCSGEWMPRPPAAVSGIVHDTAKVTAGCLFVAIRGTRVDGHAYVTEAASRGAAAALVCRERAGEAARRLPCLVVGDTVKALGDLAAGYRRHLGLRVIGVTGSAGKTTVKEMIAGLLATTYPTAKTKGNWNNEIGLPLSLLGIPETTRMGVMELGISHPGEMAPLCRIAGPDWGVITNVGPVHLEFFGSVEAIAREKGVLFSSLPPGGMAVALADEPWFGLLRGMASGRVVGVAFAGEAEYTMTNRDAAAGRGVVLEGASGERCEVCLPLPGEHNLRNALLAIAVARGCGIGWDRIQEALARYESPAMRWEQTEVGGVRIINDAYNANPMSVQAAVATFGAMEGKGGRWLVLGDMLELGPGAESEHERIGRRLASGNWSGLMTVGRLGARFADGAVAAGMAPDRVRRCGDAAEAGRVLGEAVRPGDFVLFKASRGMHLEAAVEALKAKVGAR